MFLERTRCLKATKGSNPFLSSISLTKYDMASLIIFLLGIAKEVFQAVVIDFLVKYFKHFHGKLKRKKKERHHDKPVR